MKLADMLNLSNESSKKKTSSSKHRNICVVLGCLAEKLAGPNAIFLLTSNILNYLVNNVVTTPDPSVVLFSLIALEKFAQTSKWKAAFKFRLILTVKFAQVKIN